VALVFSAFASGLEIAFLSSNKLKFEIDRQQGKFYTYMVSLFMNRQGQFITTILVANNVALVIYSIAMTAMLLRLGVTDGFSPNVQLLLSTLISTIVVLLVAEFLPKTICRLRPNFFLRAFAVPAFIIYLVCYPVAAFTTWLAVFILRYIFRRKVDMRMSETIFERTELQDLTDEVADATEGHGHEEHDIKIFRNALDFAEVKVRDCMVPRTEIEAIAIDDSVSELCTMFTKTGYSRLLVYDESIDNIIGYARSTDLFKSYRSIREMLITLDCVPESMPAQKLLASFTKNRKSIAVVIDEFGGTAGMVTLEDVMEEIFGEIKDEHDSDDLLEKQIAANEYVFAGRLEVAYINEKYHLNLEESDAYDTLAGFIIYHSERIPTVNETIAIRGISVHILRTTASKIELVKLKIWPYTPSCNNSKNFPIFDANFISSFPKNYY
jgi:CBS domain containing-hemolysin-like protein